MLPIIPTGNKAMDAMQGRWKSQIDPVLTSPTSDALILTSLVLVTGVNVINHKLGRQLQGWRLTDINAASTIYRSAPFNNLTLTLTASAPVTINLEVF